MFRVIQNIVAILNGYGNGRLFEGRKGKRGNKSGLKDLVSISDEARERFQSGADECNNPHADGMYMQYKGSGGK